MTNYCPWEAQIKRSDGMHGGLPGYTIAIPYMFAISSII